MQTFVIRVINSKTVSVDDGANYSDIEDGFAAAITAGLHMASDEILRGDVASAVEVNVEELSGQVVARGTVSITTARLVLE